MIIMFYLLRSFASLGVIRFVFTLLGLDIVGSSVHALLLHARAAMSEVKCAYTASVPSDSDAGARRKLERMNE